MNTQILQTICVKVLKCMVLIPDTQENTVIENDKIIKTNSSNTNTTYNINNSNNTTNSYNTNITNSSNTTQEQLKSNLDTKDNTNTTNLDTKDNNTTNLEDNTNNLINLENTITTSLTPSNYCFLSLFSFEKIITKPPYQMTKQLNRYLTFKGYSGFECVNRYGLDCLSVEELIYNFNNYNNISNYNISNKIEIGNDFLFRTNFISNSNNKDSNNNISNINNSNKDENLDNLKFYWKKNLSLSSFIGLKYEDLLKAYIDNSDKTLTNFEGVLVLNDEFFYNVKHFIISNTKKNNNKLINNSNNTNSNNSNISNLILKKYLKTLNSLLLVTSNTLFPTKLIPQSTFYLAFHSLPNNNINNSNTTNNNTTTTNNTNLDIKRESAILLNFFGKKLSITLVISNRIVCVESIKCSLTDHMLNSLICDYVIENYFLNLLTFTSTINNDNYISNTNSNDIINKNIILDLIERFKICGFKCIETNKKYFFNKNLINNKNINNNTTKDTTSTKEESFFYFSKTNIQNRVKDMLRTSNNLSLEIPIYNSNSDLKTILTVDKFNVEKFVSGCLKRRVEEESGGVRKVLDEFNLIYREFLISTNISNSSNNNITNSSTNNSNNNTNNNTTIKNLDLIFIGTDLFKFIKKYLKLNLITLKRNSTIPNKIYDSRIFNLTKDVKKQIYKLTNTNNTTNNNSNNNSTNDDYSTNITNYNDGRRLNLFIKEGNLKMQIDDLFNLKFLYKKNEVDELRRVYSSEEFTKNFINNLIKNTKNTTTKDIINNKDITTKNTTNINKDKLTNKENLSNTKNSDNKEILSELDYINNLEILKKKLENLEKDENILKSTDNNIINLKVEEELINKENNIINNNNNNNNKKDDNKNIINKNKENKNIINNNYKKDEKKKDIKNIKDKFKNKFDKDL